MCFCNPLPNLFGKVFTFPNMFSLIQSGINALSKYSLTEGLCCLSWEKEENSLINMFGHK